MFPPLFHSYRIYHINVKKPLLFPKEKDGKDFTSQQFPEERREEWGRKLKKIGGIYQKINSQPPWSIMGRFCGISMYVYVSLNTKAVLTLLSDLILQLKNMWKFPGGLSEPGEDIGGYLI